MIHVILSNIGGELARRDVETPIGAAEAAKEITSDGKTVWINSEEGCLGRFSHFGIDIHRTFAEQAATGEQCLDCKPGPATRADWERFKAGMLSFHRIAVTDQHMPVYPGDLITIEGTAEY